MKTITDNDVLDYISNLYLEFPKLSVKKERSSWLKLAFKAMFWKDYEDWDGFTTTIGMNIYLSPEWDYFTPESRLSLLRHEREHLKQFNKYGLVLTSLIYLFFPLPTIFALGRTYFEKAGYDESIRALVEYHNPSDDMKVWWKEWYIEEFTGPSYFWMFPFRSVVEKWFEKVWTEAKSEYGQ
jgi:hypothetical protein